MRRPWSRLQHMAIAPQNADPSALPEGEQPQVKDDLFAGTEKFAKDASDVTDVNLDRNMLGAVRGRGRDGQLANQLNFIVVHSYTYDKPGMYRMEDVEAYQKKLTSGDWSCFVHVRERKSGEATDICKRNGTEGDQHELVIITAEPKELTFVHLSGKMPFNDLQSLGQLGSLGVLMAVPPVPPCAAGAASAPCAGDGAGSAQAKTAAIQQRCRPAALSAAEGELAGVAKAADGAGAGGDAGGAGADARDCGSGSGAHAPGASPDGAA